MHVHYLQEEAARVVSGRLGHQVPGGEPQFAGPGELVVWPAGTAHKWWNAGTDELRMTGWCRPPHNIEFFLGTLFASTKENGGGRPDLFDAAFLMTRYRTEYAMLDMPAMVRRVVVPIVYAVGTVIVSTRSSGTLRRRRRAPDEGPQRTGTRCFSSSNQLSTTCTCGATGCPSGPTSVRSPRKRLSLVTS